MSEFQVYLRLNYYFAKVILADSIVRSFIARDESGSAKLG